MLLGQSFDAPAIGSWSIQRTSSELSPVLVERCVLRGRWAIAAAA